MEHQVVKGICICCALSSVNVVSANTARIGAYVIDAISQKPLVGATVRGGFDNDNGWLAWTQPAPMNEDFKVTDENGRCWVQGETNNGEAGCAVRIPPQGYYRPCRGIGFSFAKKSLLGDWLPDNLVATIRLQRVEHPIPLFVKRVKLENFEKGIFKEKGPDGVLQYDMIKGDWLPPYGQGNVCDLEISSTKVITGKDRKYRNSSRRVEDVFFFDFIQKISVSSNDCLSAVHTSPFVGIRIRNGEDDGQGAYIYRKTGRYKRIDKFREWYSTHYDDFDASRCYTFRIRSQHDENGKLIEAYYGKIYGDFELQYDDRLGLTEIRFLYYVNTTPLDKNLEWDMNNNLCPSPGALNQPLP
jgi:hypothetical protein